MKNIPAFGSISKGGKTIIENMGLGDHHHHIENKTKKPSTTAASTVQPNFFTLFQSALVILLLIKLSIRNIQPAFYHYKAFVFPYFNNLTQS